MESQKNIKIALTGSYEENEALIQALRHIDQLELCAIFNPQTSLSNIKVGTDDIPVFHDLETFIQTCNFTILALGREVPSIKACLSKAGKDQVIVIPREHLRIFQPFFKKLMEVATLNKQSEAIMEAAQEGIQVVDAQGKILYANSSFTRITKVPLKERINKNIFDVSPDGSLAEVLRTGRAVFGNTHVTEGTPIIANASPLINDGKLTGAVTVFSDASSVEKMARIIQRSKEEVASLKEAIHEMNQTKYSFQDLVGQSPAFIKCIQQAKLAADLNSTVLITGESGTGKELFAHGIHGFGNRCSGPFIKVNCPAIPANLLESELFGYEKGSFTGANKLKIGKFELANGGTIFLDEIGDMDFTLQAKLLRVLQEREFERIGGNHPIKINVRIIAATNRNLLEQIEKGLFREDLFYRLNVIHIHIPPLKERREDIPLLIDHMLKKFSRQNNTRSTEKNPLPSISKPALQELCNYEWPGNVREMENLMEKILIFNNTGAITKEDITYFLTAETRYCHNKTTCLTIKEMEKRLIYSALDKHGTTLAGKKAAAQELGISLTCLYDKLKKYK